MPKNRAARNLLLSQVDGFVRRVAPVYEMLKWEWGSPKLSYVPCAEDIRKALVVLIDGLEYDWDNCCMGNGGLEVEFNIDPPKDNECEAIQTSIRMVIEERNFYDRSVLKQITGENVIPFPQKSTTEIAPSSNGGGQKTAL